MNAHITHASHFVDWWHLQRCQIRFFPHPLNGWHDHWTFVAEWYDFTDLVCVGRIFSQTSLELEILSPTYNGVRLFFSITLNERYFFQCRMFFSQEFICMLFSSRSQSVGHFFEITHNPLKSHMVGPYNPPNIWWVYLFVEGRGFQVEREGSMSRVEGNFFFFQIFFFGKGSNRCIKKNKKNLKNKWRVNIL